MRLLERGARGACTGPNADGPPATPMTPSRGAPWVGLYRNETGTVFVSELPQGKVALRSDTRWDHGDACSWEATGVVDGENLKLDTNADPSCNLVIRRGGRSLVVAAPEYRCKEAFCGRRAFADGTFTLEPSTPP